MGKLVKSKVLNTLVCGFESRRAYVNIKYIGSEVLVSKNLDTNIHGLTVIWTKHGPRLYAAIKHIKSDKYVKKSFIPCRWLVAKSVSSNM